MPSTSETTSAAATDTGRARRVVSSDGVGLAVVEHGDPADPTVVLVHGYPDSSALWDDVVARLRDDFHVVAYDVRGAGRSDRPRRVRDYAIRQLSDDLLAVIEAVAPGRPVHLVGHDWGAIQSWESAARPETSARLSSFTAVAGPSLDLTAVGAAARRRRGDLAPRDALGQLVKSWYIMAFHLPFAPLLWRQLGRRWGVVFRRTEGARPPAGHPAATITQDLVDGIRLYRRNMLPRLLRPRYERVDVPLVQVGITLRDAFIAPDVYDDLPGRMPELWRRRADASHWIPLLDPDTVAGWIRDAVAYREAGGADGGGRVPEDAEAFRA